MAHLIVFEVCGRDDDALGSVHLLLEAEDMLVEVELQLFITVVDAHLFEGIGDETLKAKDIQHTNDISSVMGVLVDGLVDAIYEILEQISIKAFAQSVAHR